MKILYIHNSYSEKTPSGEEHASRELVSLLEAHGNTVKWFKRNSDDIYEMPFGKLYSLFSGIHNSAAAKELAKLLDDYRPDIIQVQNLYPLISSSIFQVIRKRNIPVVMRCPNYRLFCPTGLCLDRKGNVCERCWNGCHELHCIKGNCMGNAPKSIGYAIRNAFNRTTKRILNGVDIFIVQSEFQKQKFISQGIPADRIGIVPGISPDVTVPENNDLGDSVCFVGRVSAEKGIYEFIEAARLNPSIPFRVAGSLDANFVMPDNLPDNLQFVGFLKGDALNEFHTKSRIIVVPSKWYEGFPNVILRAFLFERPVITTDIGAMQSIVETNKDGILVEPGSAEALSNAIRNLYPNTDLCLKYGKAGRAKTLSSYSREQIYNYLTDIYSRALSMHK